MCYFKHLLRNLEFTFLKLRVGDTNEDIIFFSSRSLNYRRFNAI